MTDVEYVPGTWVAVVGERTWLLLSVPPESDLVRRCWELVRSDQPLDEVLAAIVHEGFRAVSGFALVTEQRAVVRGETRLEVLDGSGTTDEISGRGVGTWVDRNLADVARLRLTAGARGPVLPVRSGVVLASELVVSLSDLPQPRQPQLQQPPLPVPEPIEQPVVTREEPVELTIVHAEQPQATGVIQSFDWAPAVTAAIVRPEPVLAPPPVTDTVMRTTVMSPNDTQLLHGRAGGPRLVRAKKCPAGHLSSDYALHCRVCELPLPEQDAVMLAMPVLGLLRLSNGDTIKLDRNVVLGRDPQGDPRSANLVQVGGDADTLISRTHVEVLLQDWDVLVRDLGSTNGTTVSRPGCPPQHLAAHIEEFLYPGTRVTLGDQVFFTFEVSG